MNIKFTLAILSLPLAGCGSPPKSVEQLIAAHPSATTQCSQLPPSEVATRISEGWKRCIPFQTNSQQVVMAGKTPISISSGESKKFDVDVKSTPTSTGYIVSLGAAGKDDVLMSAEISTTPSCPSLIQSRGWNVIWNIPASKAHYFVDDPNKRCDEW